MLKVIWSKYQWNLLGRLSQSRCFKPLYERSNDQLLSQSTLFIAFYQQKASINEIIKQFGVSTNEIYQENTCIEDFLKYSHMAEDVQRY